MPENNGMAIEDNFKGKDWQKLDSEYQAVPIVVPKKGQTPSGNHGDGSRWEEIDAGEPSLTFLEFKKALASEYGYSVENRWEYMINPRNWRPDYEAFVARRKQSH